MVAWVVINRQRTRQSPPSFFPRSHSHFGSHASLISEKTTPFVSYTYVEPILQPFCFQILACNGGVYSPRGLDCLSPTPYPLLVPSKAGGSPFFSHSCALFCTFLHPPKTQLFCFQSIPHSLRKTPGVGEGIRC